MLLNHVLSSIIGHGRWLVLALVLASAVAHPAAGAATLAVRHHDGKVTVTARQAPLLQVLAELARYTTADLYVAESLAGEPVDADLQGLPVDRALAMLLAPYDFVASFGKEGLRLVKVYPRGKRNANLAQVHPRQGPPLVAIPESQADGATGRQRATPPPGSLLAGSRSLLPAPGLSAGGGAGDDQRPAPPPAVTAALDLDLQEQALLHRLWQLQHGVPMADEAAAVALPVAVGRERLAMAARQEDLVDGLQRLAWLTVSDPAFAATLEEE